MHFGGDSDVFSDGQSYALVAMGETHSRFFSSGLSRAEVYYFTSGRTLARDCLSAVARSSTLVETPALRPVLTLKR